MELLSSIALSTVTYVGDVDERECSKLSTYASSDVFVANKSRAIDHTDDDDDDKSTKEFAKDDNDATDSNVDEIEQQERQKSDKENNDKEKDRKEDKSKVEPKQEIEDNVDVDVLTITTAATTTTYDEVIVTLVEHLNINIDLEVNALLHSKYDCDNNGDDGDDNDNDNDNDNDDNSDNDNDNGNDNDDDEGELLSFEAGKKVNSVGLSKELDILFDNDIQGKNEGNNELSELQATTEKYNGSNHNLLLVPAATGNNNEEELNRNKKTLLDSDGGAEQNIVLVEKDNNFVNDNGKESNRNGTTTTKLISTRPTSRGEENDSTKRILKGEFFPDKSHDKSSLYIIRKGKTKESIKKITSKSFQVKKESFSCKSTTIGRILIKKIEDRTSLHLSKKKVLRDDSKWYNRKRCTKKIDESVSFMRSTESFSNYIYQTQRQLKKKAEEKKRCAKKIVI